MIQIDQNKKIERINFFKIIQNLILEKKYYDLKQFLIKNRKSNDNFFSEFNDKVEYKQSEIKIKSSQLENSKDRLSFLNKLVTSQTSGNNLIKNFMEQFRKDCKIVENRRSKEREQRLMFLKSNRQNNSLLETAHKLNREQKRKIQEQKRFERKNIAQLKKQQLQKKILPEIVKKPIEILATITKKKSSQEERLDNISFKDGNINSNCELLEAGFYELIDYNKAIIFKFTINFDTFIKDKVIDLIDQDGDLLLHINIRNNEKTIVFNTNINNIWGKENKIKREMQGSHTLKILTKNDFFKILDNDQIISFFSQRKYSKIKYLNINDNVKDFIFKVM